MRWRAPISFAIHAPGYDFAKALESIQYVRNCLKDSSLIRSYVTFHLYFNQDHMPNDIPFNETEALNTPYYCSMPPPYKDVIPDSMYKKKQKLFYPINVGRNIARKAALTHLILASDVELYPSLGFVEQFLDMVMRDPSVLGVDDDKPRVFPLATFEIDEQATIPDTKKELQKLLKERKAISFHLKVCFECHSIPKLAAWIKANETNQLNVFTVGKRYDKQASWEPFYVSDNREPFFDERFTWEGKKNKRIQAYAMCLLDYEFHVLNNAFLIHKPGIKIYKYNTLRVEQTALMNKLVNNTIIPEYKKIYGNRKKCLP
ncbi:beta-1,4-glucuronyltransferase 1-like isoform X2 [Episyrphus balteatus]|uniref:beta-1,4-glucuronyltransferase 1-like isoform X2 n=1 Tax=Episyrphus balteatus TaxID=286459 RepID=UPI002485E2FD|nr:beta-1,4-glucuronyltransferase 1-like isoform X2 [Episyrphus balteatus]